MIDIHSHILPGIDDGARSVNEACDMARDALTEGVTVMVATPHVKNEWPTTPERVESGVGELRAELADAAIELDVLPGAEISLERLGQLGADDLRRFSLGQTGIYVLVECPYSGSPLELVPAIKALRDSGVTTVVAHPERNPGVEERPARLESLVELGALVQVTAASVDGRLGRSAKVTAESLLDLGLVHVIASDAHGPHIRRSGLGTAAEAVGDPVLARYLTEESPAAILAGEPVSAPPPRRRRRRLRFF